MNPPFHPPFLLHIIGSLLRIALVAFAAYMLLRYYLQHTKKELPPPARDEDSKVILPLRLQACERFVLYLERIHPSNLLLRLNTPGITAQQLQILLVKTIREEFEYNLSQQLYISNASWEMIRNAKEETIAMINQSMSKVGEDVPSEQLVKEVFDNIVAQGKLSVDKALEQVKSEVQRSF